MSGLVDLSLDLNLIRSAASSDWTNQAEAQVQSITYTCGSLGLSFFRDQQICTSMSGGYRIVRNVWAASEHATDRIAKANWYQRWQAKSWTKETINKIVCLTAHPEGLFLYSCVTSLTGQECFFHSIKNIQTVGTVWFDWSDPNKRTSPDRVSLAAPLGWHSWWKRRPSGKLSVVNRMFLRFQLSISKMTWLVPLSWRLAAPLLN